MSSGSDSDSSSSSQTSDRRRDWSPPQTSYGHHGRSLPQASDGRRDWSPPQTSDRHHRSQSEETRDHSNRSPNTSPARYRNLWAMGVDPQDYRRKWSDQQASTSGTSPSEIEQLSERLSKMQAVRDWMEAGPWKVFENTLAGCLEAELATAKRLGVKPMHADDPGFGKVANEDESMNWVVTERGDLLFAPHSAKGEAIAHTVLTDGGPVVAAGEAVIVADGNERLCIEITNHSGHYLPNESSLDIGKQAFKAFGITFLGDDSGKSNAESGGDDGNDGNGDGHNGGHDGYNSSSDGHHGSSDGDGNSESGSDAAAQKAQAECLEKLLKDAHDLINQLSNQEERLEKLKEELNGNPEGEPLTDDTSNSAGRLTDTSSIPKKTAKHLLNRHSFSRVQNQLKYQLEGKPRADVEADLADRSFFNRSWTEEQCLQAAEIAFKHAKANNIVSHRFTCNVFGEDITVVLENGILQTSWGPHEYALADFGL